MLSTYESLTNIVTEYKLIQFIDYFLKKYVKVY